jgi:hypothetical protein
LTTDPKITHLAELLDRIVDSGTAGDAPTYLQLERNLG